MILFKKANELHKWLENQRENKHTIGFVPTMGALHQGHISLVSEAKSNDDVVVASIFVNPTQFNDPNDFKKYPVTIDKDIEMLEAAGCDVLFLPDVSEIYPDGLVASRHYDLGYLETILEGKYRPGHFQGVCMVVHRLLEIVLPNTLYLGQKDYQQCMVLQKLLVLIGMDKKTSIHIVPTLREPSGLAMSSRNTRLSDAERLVATEIYKTLTFIRENNRQDITYLKQTGRERLEQAGFQLDYVEIAQANDLSPASNGEIRSNQVALVAAYLNEVRLIDNMLLSK
jgi:pantoate--beta-alanine ligase